MIEVGNLSFQYPGAPASTLEGLTLSVGDGEVFGLLGPSGAGKSTTQKILMGLLRGWSGRAEVFGSPVGTLGRPFYERIGVSFELPSLYLRLTARENLDLFAAFYKKRCRPSHEVLQIVGLEEAIDQRVGNFSKGMKMRLNLARALLNDPQLLFLDEPTAGQDPARAAKTRQLILDLKAEGRTIFLTTHNMAEAEQVCDRVGFLFAGNIPLTGRPQELKRSFGAPVVDVTLESPEGLASRQFALDGLGENEAFLQTLRGGQVVALHTHEATLDEIFVAATSGKTPVRENHS